jgi:hypothetical protein
VADDLPWYRDPYQLRNALAKAEWSIPELARATNVAQRTLAHWWSEYRKQGVVDYPPGFNIRAHAQLRQHRGRKAAEAPDIATAANVVEVVREVEPAEVMTLRRALARKSDESALLKRELDAAVRDSNHREDILALLVPVAENAAYPAPPRPRKTNTGRKRTPVEIVVHLCDIHWGEIVRPESVGEANAYNCRISALRIEHVIRVVRGIAADQPGGVSRIVLAVNGDAVSGQHILHPGSADEESRIVKQVLDVAAVISQAALELSEVADEVLVIGTQGNHGRSEKKQPTGRARIETSWETLLHEFVAAFTHASKRVKTRVARAYTVTEKIGPSLWAFQHGDATKGGGGQLGIPAYGLKRRHDANREWSMVIAEMTERAIAEAVIRHTRSAHFHTFFAWQAGRGTIVLAPSIKGIDSYVLDSLGKYSPAACLVEVIHPEHDLVRQTVVEVGHINANTTDKPRYQWGALETELNTVDIVHGQR